jgi:hypothetical protein
VRAVVPKPELLAASPDLALAHLGPRVIADPGAESLGGVLAT